MVRYFEMDASNLFFEDAPQENEAGSAPTAAQPPGQDLGDNGLEDIPMEVTKKKRHMKPVPKLDVQRLLGPRGLPCLNAEFENVKFKGKGHEAEDLDLMMSHLEHWAHRLYPKMMFDDCLEKIESLGHKKEVRVCLKKIRLGMPLLNSDEQTTVITTDGPDNMEDDMQDDILNMDDPVSPRHNDD